MSGSILLRGGTLLTMAGKPFVGDILIRDQKIAAVGEHLSCETEEVIDAAGSYVMPGLVDAHSHIGLMRTGSREKDHNELTSPITPQVRAIDAIDPLDPAFQEARAGGVTTSVTGPGSMNIIGGTFAAVKSFGVTVEDMLLQEPVAMKAALGENPKTFAPDNALYPKSRLGIAAKLREALVEADNYRRRVELGRGEPRAFVPRDLKNEALLPVLDRALPLKIHAHRHYDIMTAIRICDEFNVRFTLDHCTDGHLVTEALAQAQQRNCDGVIIGPFHTYKGKPEVDRRIDHGLAAALQRGGVRFAMMSDFYETQPDSLLTHAALAVAEGLSEDTALRAVTIDAAKIVGLDHRIGSLEVGKDADLAVFSSHPLDIRARCSMTFINGKLVRQR